MRRAGQVETPRDLYAAPLEGRDLIDEMIEVDHDPVADDAAHLWPKNSGWDQVEDEDLAGQIDRVPCIRPARVAGDPVHPLGEEIDDLPLSLVSPLASQNDRRGHWHLLFWPSDEGNGADHAPIAGRAQEAEESDQCRAPRLPARGQLRTPRLDEPGRLERTRPGATRARA